MNQPFELDDLDGVFDFSEEDKLDLKELLNSSDPFESLGLPTEPAVSSCPSEETGSQRDASAGETNKTNHNSKKRKVSPTHSSKDNTPTRRTTRRKGPGVPKRPLSAFTLFFQRECPKLAESREPMSFEERGKLISQRWRSLTEAERKEYERMAKNDVFRYRREIGSRGRGSNSGAASVDGSRGSSSTVKRAVGGNSNGNGGAGDDDSIRRTISLESSSWGSNTNQNGGDPLIVLPVTSSMGPVKARLPKHSATTNSALVSTRSSEYDSPGVTASPTYSSERNLPVVTPPRIGSSSSSLRCQQHEQGRGMGVSEQQGYDMKTGVSDHNMMFERTRGQYSPHLHHHSSPHVAAAAAEAHHELMQQHHDLQQYLDLQQQQLQHHHDRQQQQHHHRHHHNHHHERNHHQHQRHENFRFQSQPPQGTMTVPPGMELVLPDKHGRERRYRVQYTCYRMTRSQADAYMMRLARQGTTSSVSSPSPCPGSSSSPSPAFASVPSPECSSQQNCW